MSSSTDQHRAMAAERGPVSIAIVTVSDTRTPETDVNHHYLRDEIVRAGHRVVGYHLIRDEPAQVMAALDTIVATEARVVLINGGTALPRATTPTTPSVSDSRR